MSEPEKANLKATFKTIHSNFIKRVDCIILETKEFKESIDTVFSDFTQQCMDVEDRLKDVLIQKKVILAEYEILQRKDKEGCKKCSAMEANLIKASKKLKQYELKMKNIANLLYVNTANTEANQLNLMSHMMAEESQDSQIDKTEVINKEYPAEQRTSKVNGKGDSQAGARNSQTKSQVPEQGDIIYFETTLGENGHPTSKILVHEEDDEIYFETTLKRKTPDDVETVLEIPETFCEEFEHFDRAKRAQDENSPIQQETPSKKRKLSQRSPKVEHSQQYSQPVGTRSQTSAPVSPLQVRNKTVVAVADRDNIMQTSPSLISKPRPRCHLETQDKMSRSPRIKNSPKKVKSPGKAKKNFKIESIEEKEEQPSSSIDYGVEEKQEMHQESRESSANDETRFLLFEPKEDQKETDKSIEDKKKAKTKDKKMNGSKIWENIEFSDDSDDFVEQRKSKHSSQKKETSFSFTKPAGVESCSTKWNLKPLNSSINKSKLKQTKLTLEKKVNKIDITQVEGYNGGVMPSSNSKSKELREEPKKYIIEETQELEHDADDEDEIVDTTKKRRSHVRTTSPDLNNPSKSFTLLTLPEESMFIPNAVSTQKTKSQSKNSNSCKQSMSRDSNSLPKKNPSPSRNKSPGKTPPNAFKKPSTRSSTNSKTEACSNRSSFTKKVLFLPKDSKHNVDYSPQWKCVECIDYFVESYGATILTMRPPPKKCGHSSKYPSSTPPDFWDPMCS